MPDFPFDTKSFFAGVHTAQALKGHAKAASNPTIRDIPPEYLQQSASTLPGGNAHVSAWAFDERAFYSGIAAGRALEGWQIDPVVPFETASGDYWTRLSNGLLYIFKNSYGSSHQIVLGNTRTRKVLLGPDVNLLTSWPFDKFYIDTLTALGNQIPVCNFSGEAGAIYHVRLANGITRIPAQAFFKAKVKSITIPLSVTSIGNSAFYGCFTSASVYQPGTGDIYYAGTPEQWEQIDIDYSDMAYYTGGNRSIYSATIHYNSTGPDDVHD